MVQEVIAAMDGGTRYRKTPWLALGEVEWSKRMHVADLGDFFKSLSKVDYLCSTTKRFIGQRKALLGLVL